MQKRYVQIQRPEMFTTTAAVKRYFNNILRNTYLLNVIEIFDSVAFNSRTDYFSSFLVTKSSALVSLIKSYCESKVEV